MSTIALSGNDTLSLFNRVFADFATGDWAKFTFPNDVAGVKTGKGGNSIFAENTTGRQMDGELAVILGSPDDKFLNALYQQAQLNFQGQTLLFGEFVKNVGNGKGQITQVVYVLQTGVFIRGVDVKSNAEGDTDQSIAIYRFRFSNAARAIT